MSIIVSQATLSSFYSKKGKQISFYGKGKQKIFCTNRVPDCTPALVYPMQLWHVDTATDPLSYTKRQRCMLPSTWSNYLTETATQKLSLHNNRVCRVQPSLLNVKNSTIKNWHYPKPFQLQEAAWIYHAFNILKQLHKYRVFHMPDLPLSPSTESMCQINERTTRPRYYRKQACHRTIHTAISRVQ